MTVAGDGLTERLPAARRASASRLDDALVVDVLSRLAGADSTADVAAAALPPLLELPGVRAGCVVVRDGDDVAVVGSAGYDCTTMAPGARLPLDAGLPLTEAVRTGRPVVQGTGPSWVAVPFGRARRGALLLSLTGAPPDDASRLDRIARAVGDALHRAGEQERAFAELALVTAGLGTAVPAPAAGWSLAVRSQPYDGPVGGDVVVVQDDGRGGTWFVVADVCGAGLPAAVLGRTVAATVTALVPHLPGPAALLAAAEAAVRPVVPPGSFVTALAVRVEGDRLEVASAGHPAPLLVTPSGGVVVPVEPGTPLALETGGAPGQTTTAALPPGAALLLHTDGLLDRVRDGAPVPAEVEQLLLSAAGARDLDALADGLLRAADAVGRAGDDVTVLLARRSG